MPCPLRHNPGSGYDKPCDPVLAKTNKEAMAKLQAERAAQDARMAAAWKAPATDPKKKETTPASPRFQMRGD
jgi:hypothetical protein